MAFHAAAHVEQPALNVAAGGCPVAPTAESPIVEATKVADVMSLPRIIDRCYSNSVAKVLTC
jgi:hypothetical protein